MIALIRATDDDLTRAQVWALLDRYTPDNDLQDLHDELDAIVGRRNE